MTLVIDGYASTQGHVQAAITTAPVGILDLLRSSKTMLQSIAKHVGARRTGKVDFLVVQIVEAVRTKTKP